MRNKCRKKEIRGYTILEVLVSVVLISIVMVSIVSYLRNTNDLFISEIKDKACQNQKTTYQERALNGFFEEGLDFNLNESLMSEQGKVAVKQWNIQNLNGQEARSSSAGYTIAKVGESISREKIVLEKPKFNFGNSISANNFPLKNFLNFSEKYVGTYYTYTIDGSIPSETSKIWDFPIFTLNNVPNTIQVRAFNQDHQPSKVSTFEFNIIWSPSFTREEATLERDHFNYEEVLNRKNGILLTGGGDDKLTKIEYKFEGGEYSPYNGPLYVPLNNWNKDGAKLIVRYSPKSENYLREYETTLTFKIKKGKLKKPELRIPKSKVVRVGESIGIDNQENKYGRTRTFYKDKYFGSIKNIKVEE